MFSMHSQDPQKAMKLVSMLMVNMSLRTLKLIILRMKSLFFSAVLIILWTECVSTLKIVSTTPEGVFFRMQLDNTCYKTKKCYQCYRISIKMPLKYYLRFFCWKKRKIEFLRFSSSAITPTQDTKDSDGFDLYSVENIIVPANSMKIIKTDIGFKIPGGYFGKI